NSTAHPFGISAPDSTSASSLHPRHIHNPTDRPSLHSPIVPNGRHAQVRSSCRSLPIFKPTPWLEDLGDYMITTGL
ncbi:unnamed protein product, partial [Prunus brigantina]